jgi:hypothetical protein
MNEDLGAWARAARGNAQTLNLEWVDEDLALFDPLPGWKSPLWRVEGGCLELLRPEGLWRADLKGRASPFRARERGAEGWSSRRGVEIDPTLQTCWRAQFGARACPHGLDAAMEPPAECEKAHASGELAKWELTEEGGALAWLDDAFERGPLSCSRAGPYLLVSNGAMKVAYFVGAAHWAWPMVDRGLLSVRLGRGGGWEPEREMRPIVL